MITVRVDTSTGTGIAEFTPSSGIIVGMTAVPGESLPGEGKPNLTIVHEVELKIIFSKEV
jgi:hypothetical protein